MSKEMVSKLVKKGVVVIRDGARVRPQIDKNFDFTSDEVESINAATPGSLVNPVSTEKGEAVAASVSKGSGKTARATTKAGSNAEAAQAGAKGGSKKATASKADGEDGGDKKDDDL